MKIVIHAGLHKTGTTLFQKEIWPKWDGINYLHRPVSVESLNDLNGGDGIVLFSSEGVSGNLKYLTQAGRGNNRTEIFVSAIGRLKEFAPNAYIIVGMRNHKSLILSYYKHYVKYGGFQSFEDFFNKKHGSSYVWETSFSTMISALQSAFPGRFFPFFIEELKLWPDKLFLDMADFIGTKAPLFQNSYKTYNEGLEHFECELATSVNKYLSGDVVKYVPKTKIASFRSAGFRIAKIASALRLIDGGKKLEINPGWPAFEYAKDHSVLDLSELWNAFVECRKDVDCKKLEEKIAWL